MQNEIEDFTTLIREIASEEIDKKLKENGIYKTINGTVVEKNNKTGKYKIDIIDGYANEVLNQSGSNLTAGDSVVISEKYGSNLSNCIISSKNNTEIPTQNFTIIEGIVTEVEYSSTTATSNYIVVFIDQKKFNFMLSHPSNYKINDSIPILKYNNQYYCFEKGELIN